MDFLITIFILAIVAGGAYLIYKRYNASKTNTTGTSGSNRGSEKDTKLK